MSKAKLWESVIYLEPIQHKYHHRETGKTYKSVTTTLTSIEPHFDSESVSAAIVNQADNAKQERYVGLTQQEILDFWQQLNDDANIYGSKVHDIVERYLLANKWYFTDDTEDGLFEQKVIEGYNALNIDEGIAMWPERILFAEQYELAGMSDLIIDIDQTYFDVWDLDLSKIKEEIGLDKLENCNERLEAFLEKYSSSNNRKGNLTTNTKREQELSSEGNPSTKVSKPIIIRGSLGVLSGDLGFWGTPN